MVRKTGGLAAIMSGQPVIVVKKKSMFWRLKALTRQSGLHIGLILLCFIYVYIGALFFMHLEGSEEKREHRRVLTYFNSLKHQFLSDFSKIRKSNESINILIDKYSKNLMFLFENPIASNMFDCLFYHRRNYTPLWTSDSSLLFTATTIIPVGFGYISPVTTIGRIFLCIYAGFGVPLALVMMSDIGKFLADIFVKVFNDNINAFMIALLTFLVGYLLIGGVAIAKSVGIPIIEGIYFSTITIFTIGYGDVSPNIPAKIVIIFLVFGVALVTISIDVIAANIIHNIHYMGRQMGKAKIIADKMITMAQKININRGLGLGMSQLGAFAKMGMMINVTPSDKLKKSEATSWSKNSISNCSNNEEDSKKMSAAFEPNIEFDMIDIRNIGSSRYLYGFGFERFESTTFSSDDQNKLVFM